eukprot:TRINITY_DN2313_c0_g1_i3.p1 TRINITY_DN2313_c0_g1~~TRINITY_DN2313_c0_g1_i3.p1  ORF type:complete len:219 (+),score=23.48 TRINITY_DN2313_c0_g1_i3:55-711(+)
MENTPDRFKPYTRDDPGWTTYEIIKIILVSIFLVPLRLIVATLAFTWYWCVVKMGAIGHEDFVNKPLSSWRRNFFISVGGPMARVLMFFLGFYTVKQTGSNSLKDEKGQANIIISNHTSYLDIFMMMVVSDTLPGFVAKRDVTKIPFIGFKSLVWGCLYVDNRTKQDSKKINDESPGSPNLTSLITRRGKEIGMPPIVCFPEGTTTNGKYISLFIFFA